MKMLITDFDGTLYRSSRSISDNDLKTLASLQKNNITTVIATGRSLYSFEREMATQLLPIDYIIFSTGAGIATYPDPTTNIIKEQSFSQAQARSVMDRLLAMPYDFMIHHPIPDNHYFQYRKSGGNNPDFETRLKFYAGFCEPVSSHTQIVRGASQFLVMVPVHMAASAISHVKRALGDAVNVIQTTSPFDGQTVWIEIFPKRVSKSIAADWLASKLGIKPVDCIATGNDYNDMDLLEWAGQKFIVSNAPDQMKKKFPVVASNNDSGVSEAVQKGLKQKN